MRSPDQPESTESLEGLLKGKVFFRIGEVAEICGLKPHVIRFWETEFSILVASKSRAGQRIYKQLDIENLLLIKHLLYTERYSIEGAKKAIQELRKEGALAKFRKEVQKTLLAPQTVLVRLKQLLAEIQTSKELVFKF